VEKASRLMHEQGVLEREVKYEELIAR